LLISEPEHGTPSTVMQVVKQRFARSVLRRKNRSSAQSELWADSEQHVWQRRFYDFNVWSARKRIEKLSYMHRNPVKRGLVLEPEQWEWSSFRNYAYQEVGRVRVNLWPEPVLKIEPGIDAIRARGATLVVGPPFCKSAKDGPPRDHPSVKGCATRLRGNFFSKPTLQLAETFYRY